MTRFAASLVVFFLLLAPTSPGHAEDEKEGIKVRLVNERGERIEPTLTGVPAVLVRARNVSKSESHPVAAETRVDNETGRLYRDLPGYEHIGAGAWEISVAIPGTGVSEQRFVYVEPGELAEVEFTLIENPRSKKDPLDRAAAARRSGDTQAYEAAENELQIGLANANAGVESASSTVERLQEEVLSDPNVRRSGALRRDLEHAKTPYQKAQVIGRYQDKQADQIRSIGKNVKLKDDAWKPVHKLGELKGLYEAQIKFEGEAEAARVKLGKLGPAPKTQPAYEPGSMNPAGPGQFYATLGSGLEYVDLPDFGYVNFADFQNQVTLRRNVVSDQLDDDVGFGVAVGGGYVLANSFLGNKNWIDLKLGYANVDSGNHTSAIATNADQEFFGPDGIGFTLLGPNGGLQDVNLDTKYRGLDLRLRVAADLPPCGCDITLTPIVGVVYRRMEFDAAMTLDAGSVKVARRDELTSDAGGYELGLYASKPFGQITLYSGVHTSGVYQDADGHSRLVASGGADFFDRKNLSKSGFVVDVGGSIGLRYDWKDWLSVGLEGGVDWTNGALSAEYSQEDGRRAKLDFENSFGTSLALKLIVPLSF
jgi:hypothetical protein